MSPTPPLREPLPKRWLPPPALPSGSASSCRQRHRGAARHPPIGRAVPGIGACSPRGSITPSSGSLRLFFALPVPPEVCQDLHRAARECSADWRPVPEHQLHVTLAFLGEVTPDDLPRVEAVGAAAAVACAPFPIALAETGCFPNDHHPRVWWVRVVAPPLTPLAERLLRDLGPLADQKPFKAHLTLARPRGPCAAVRNRTFPHAWQADRIELFRSTLTDRGAQHVLVRTFPLGVPTAP